MLNLEDTQTAAAGNTKTLWQDPILLDLHATREKLSSLYGNDVYAICDAARKGNLHKQGFPASELFAQNGLCATQK